jgi:hypothetical protein
MRSKVRWVIPPVAKTPAKARFDVTSEGTPLIGYGEIENFLLYPDKEYVVKFDTGYSDFACLDNGLSVFANGNDIAILARTKDIVQTKKGIPILGLQPVTSVPVRECSTFGSFGDTTYCSGLNEKSGMNELYLLEPDKASGIRELEKAIGVNATISAVTGYDNYLFVTTGRRVIKIDRTSREITPVYTHPSVIIKGLAYSPQS